MSTAKPNIVKGAFLSIAMRWTDRVVGLLSTVILARILVPEDFGIIATASLVIALADVLLEMGVYLALMQEKNPSVAHYNTAWTIRLIQTSIMTAVVLAAAPFAAHYFNNPALTPVIRVLALTFVLEGLENIWIITLQKDQLYTRDFHFMFAKRMAGFVVTISAALATHSYWALVAGNLTGRLAGVVLSYLMHPSRPRLSLEKFHEIFSISQWILVRSIARYFQERLHQIIVANRETSATMGAYTLAGQIAALPTTELLAPLNRVLFPAFVKVKDDLAELKRVFLLAQGVQALIGIPAGVGLALVAREVVEVMLGDKWLVAVPYVEILALLSCLVAITTSGFYVIVTLGKMRLLAFYGWSQVAVFAVLAYLVFPDAGAEAVAQLRLAMAAFGLISFTVLLRRELTGLKARELAAAVIRPALGAAVMASAILAVEDALAMPALAMLLFKILVGASVYASAVLVLWQLTGRRDGAESYLLEKFFHSRLRRA